MYNSSWIWKQIVVEYWSEWTSLCWSFCHVLCQTINRLIDMQEYELWKINGRRSGNSDRKQLGSFIKSSSSHLRFLWTWIHGSELSHHIQFSDWMYNCCWCWSESKVGCMDWRTASRMWSFCWILLFHNNHFILIEYSYYYQEERGSVCWCVEWLHFMLSLFLWDFFQWCINRSWSI